MLTYTCITEPKPVYSLLQLIDVIALGLGLFMRLNLICAFVDSMSLRTKQTPLNVLIHTEEFYFMKLKLSKSTKNTVTNHLKDKFLFTLAEIKVKIVVRDTTLAATAKIFINTSCLHTFATTL